MCNLNDSGQRNRDEEISWLIAQKIGIPISRTPEQDIEDLNGHPREVLASSNTVRNPLNVLLCLGGIPGKKFVETPLLPADELEE